MSSYSLQIALFKSIFKESSEVQLSLYLKLIENILYTDYFSGVMNCIIKIYIDDKITNYIPIPIEMPKEKEEDLKTKQKKHMEQKLQQKKDHEFTAADRKLIGDLMEEAMGKIVRIGTVQIEAPPAAGPAVAATCRRCPRTCRRCPRTCRRCPRTRRLQTRVCTIRP